MDINKLFLLKTSKNIDYLVYCVGKIHNVLSHLKRDQRDLIEITLDPSKPGFKTFQKEYKNNVSNTNEPVIYTNSITEIARWSISDPEIIGQLMDYSKNNSGRFYLWCFENDRYDLLRELIERGIVYQRSEYPYLVHELSPNNLDKKLLFMIGYLNIFEIDYYFLKKLFSIKNYNLISSLVNEVTKLDNSAIDTIFDSLVRHVNSDITILKILIESGYEINNKILFHVCKHSLVKTQYLIEQGVEYDMNLIVKINGILLSVLQYFISLGNDLTEEMLEFLVTRSFQNNYGEILEFLLENYDVEKYIDKTIIDKVIMLTDHNFIKDLRQRYGDRFIEKLNFDELMAKSINITIYLRIDNKAIIFSAYDDKIKKYHTNIIKLCIDNGVNVDDYLISAIKAENIFALDLLLELGANTTDIFYIKDIIDMYLYHDTNKVRQFMDKLTLEEQIEIFDNHMEDNTNIAVKYLIENFIDVSLLTDTIAQRVIYTLIHGNLDVHNYLMNLDLEYECTYVQQIAIEIIKKNNQTVISMLDSVTRSNKLLLFLIMLTDNLELLKYVLDLNNDPDYLQWALIFSGSKPKLMIHIIENTDVDIMARIRELNMVINIFDNASFLADFLMLHGCYDFDQLYSGQGIEYDPDYPVTEYLVNDNLKRIISNSS